MAGHSSLAERLGAVVVNHDGGVALLECVASLQRAGLSRIVVVDNASSDGSLVRLAAAQPSVVIVPTGANLGYGGAANRGAERVGTEFLLICNADLVLDTAAAAVLLDALAGEPDLAACGPRILDAAGQIYPSARAFPSLGDAAGHALVGFLRPDNPFTRRYRLGAKGEPDDAGVTEVDWVSGSCVAVRAIAFASVGGFDEGYFMYVEDLDLCWRLRRAGWRVGYADAASVLHHGGASTRHHPYRMLVAHHRSTWRFARRSLHGRKRLALPFVAAGLAVRLVVAIGTQRLRSDPF